MILTKKGPIITVCIPVYNPNPIHLQNCITSTCLQTLDSTKYAVMIVLDGPANATIYNTIERSIINSIQYKIINRPRTGLVGVLNYAISICNTKYFARMDCDDIMHPRRLELQLAKLENNEDIGLVGSRLAYINNYNLPVKGSKVSYPLSDFIIRIYGSIYNNPIAHPSCIARTELIKKSGGYRFEPPIEDYALWARLSLISKLSNVPQKLTYYRLHCGQITSRFKAPIYEILVTKSLFALGLCKRYFWFTPFTLLTIPLSLVVLLRLISRQRGIS